MNRPEEGVRVSFIDPSAVEREVFGFRHRLLKTRAEKPTPELYGFIRGHFSDLTGRGTIPMHYRATGDVEFFNELLFDIIASRRIQKDYLYVRSGPLFYSLIYYFMRLPVSAESKGDLFYTFEVERCFII